MGATLSWAAQLLLLFLFLFLLFGYYRLSRGVRLQLIYFLGNKIGCSVVISAKLRSLCYRAIALPRNCAGFYSQVQTAMSSSIINPTSQVPSPNKKNARTKKQRNANQTTRLTIILKSFIRHVNANTNTTGYDFFSLITSQSITSDCPAKTVQSYNLYGVQFVQFYGHRTPNWKWQPIGRSAKGGRSQRRSCNTAD